MNRLVFLRDFAWRFLAMVVSIALVSFGVVCVHNNAAADEELASYDEGYSDAQLDAGQRHGTEAGAVAGENNGLLKKVEKSDSYDAISQLTHDNAGIRGGVQPFAGLTNLVHGNCIDFGFSSPTINEGTESRAEKDFRRHYTLDGSRDGDVYYEKLTQVTGQGATAFDRSEVQDIELIYNGKLRDSAINMAKKYTQEVHRLQTLTQESELDEDAIRESIAQVGKYGLMLRALLTTSSANKSKLYGRLLEAGEPGFADDENNVIKFQGDLLSTVITPEDFTKETGFVITGNVEKTLDGFYLQDSAADGYYLTPIAEDGSTPGTGGLKFRDIVPEANANEYISVVVPTSYDIDKLAISTGEADFQRFFPVDQPGLPDPSKPAAPRIATSVAVDDKTEFNAKQEALQAKEAELETVVENDTEYVVIYDNVEVKNLVRGEEYTLDAQLVRKPEKDQVVTPIEGVVGKQKFVAGGDNFDAARDDDGNSESVSGMVRVKILLPKSELEKDVESFIAFETLTSESEKAQANKADGLSEGAAANVIAQHDDPTDQAQTIFIEKVLKPSITTSLDTEPTGIDETDANKLSFHRSADKKGEFATFFDTVRVNNVLRGKEYTLTADLIDKATGKHIAGIDAQPITFTPGVASIGSVFKTGADDGKSETLSGTVLVPIAVPKEAFKFDAAQPKSFVAFETLTSEDAEAQVVKADGLSEGAAANVIAEHKDPEDGNQTITIETPVESTEDPEHETTEAPEASEVPEVTHYGIADDAQTTFSEDADMGISEEVSPQKPVKPSESETVPEIQIVERASDEEDDEYSVAEVEPGATKSVTFEVVNTGSTPMKDIAVTDMVSSAEQVTCEDQPKVLDPGESFMCTAMYSAPESDSQEEDISDALTGEDHFASLEDIVDSEKSVKPVKDSDPAKAKPGSGGARQSAGSEPSKPGKPSEPEKVVVDVIAGQVVEHRGESKPGAKPSVNTGSKAVKKPGARVTTGGHLRAA
ncbi:VaFE repeat-containing surface-anchored protein [Corynebacterium sp. sy039]|uniref:VaFE repeat-containing surface-anchored protein n=1 Tax=Corynebacterium sp. sy039 TaxID=2599641 RepID=UPI0011B60AC5|nr:VaFE repeat-containing surface-anchored protein [Corynebacterium sp. sy039]QDZ41858.1 hypothetical protein FQV43_00760 [Corynebacterium sp. sy039]